MLEREGEKVYCPRYNNTAVKTESIKTQSGGLPERHKPIYCKVQGAGCKGRRMTISAALLEEIFGQGCDFSSCG